MQQDSSGSERSTFSVVSEECEGATGYATATTQSPRSHQYVFSKKASKLLPRQNSTSSPIKKFHGASSCSPTASERSSPSSSISSGGIYPPPRWYPKGGSNGLYYIGRQEAIDEDEDEGVVRSTISEKEEHLNSICSLSEARPRGRRSYDLERPQIEDDGRLEEKRLAFRRSRPKSFAVIQVHRNESSCYDLGVGGQSRTRRDKNGYSKKVVTLPTIDTCDDTVTESDVKQIDHVVDVEAGDDPCFMLENDLLSYGDPWFCSDLDQTGIEAPEELFLDGVIDEIKEIMIM